MALRMLLHERLTGFVGVALIIAVVSCTGLTADQSPFIPSCLYNNCQNGGICYTVSDAAVPQPNAPCPDGFNRLNEGCFMFHEHRKTRSDAAVFCQQRNAALVGVGDKSKMGRLGNFARQLHSEKFANQEPLNLWVKTPFKWRPNEPASARSPFPLPGSAACYALHVAPITGTMPIPMACDARLPFICELNLSAAAGATSTLEADEVHQCQCRQQYEGQWCQTRLAAGVGNYGAGLKCADDVVHLACPAASRVEVDYAVYGEIVNKVNVCTATTTGEMARFNPKCSMPNALIWLKERCHGRSRCRASLNALRLFSPCPDTPLQLQYRYRCVEQSSVQCSEGQFLLDNGCYEIFNNFKATWDEARMFCQLYGGELPPVLTLDSETVVIQALNRVMNSSQQQSVQVWIGYRHSNGDIYDDGASQRLSGNETFGSNETQIERSILPSSWQKRFREPFRQSRSKRDESVVEDTCLDLAVLKSDEPLASWHMTGCGRKLAWICRFPAGVKVPATADDEPPEDVQERSVPIVGATSAPSSPDRKSLLPSYSSAFTQESGVEPPSSTPIYPLLYPLPPIPPLNITFPPLPPLKPIPDIPAIPTIGPPEPHFLHRRPECPQTTADGHVWQKSVTGTFMVHSCFNGNWTLPLDDRTVHEVRHNVESFAPEQVNLFDANVARYPYGFTFWCCVETMGGPRYLPVDGPISQLCEQASILGTASRTTPAPAVIPPTNFLAEQFATYTASGGLSGLEILRSVDTLQTMLAEQTKLTKAVAASRTLDLDEQAQAINATHQFVNVVSRSVSNMLMDVHIPGWSELDTDARSGAATGLIRAAEDSAAMLAVAWRDTAVRTNVDYPNFAMEVNIIPASVNQSLSYKTMNSSANHQGADSDGYNVLTLPPSIGSFAGRDGNVRLAFMQYSEALSTLLSPITPNFTSNASDRSNQTLLGMVNSKIIAAAILQNGQMSDSVKFDNNFVTLTLAHTYKDGLKPRCVFWNMQNKTNAFWDSTGCFMAATNDTHTTCTCNHLTNFAVLMDLNGKLQYISKANQLALDIISYIGCVVSIICLSLCLIIFTFFRQLWCDRVTIHRNLVFCLLIAQFVFVLGVDRVYNQIGCSITAGMLHYTLLAAFAWMLLEGLQLYMMLVQVFESEDSHRVYYYAFGYGCPAIIVAVAAGIRPDHYGTPKYCWLLPSDGFVWSFVGPVALVVGINLMFLGIALMAVFRTKSPARQQNGFQKVRGWLRGSIMLLCLLGTTWLFGLLYINYATTLVFAYLFTIANSLQGLFIFVFHCVMNEKVFSTVQRYIGRCRWCPKWCKACIGTPKTSSTSGSNSKTSSHSIKEGSHSRRNSTTMWNFLKKRGGHRLSMDSAMSLQLPIGKQMYDSDYWSKTSSYKSNRAPYNRQRSALTGQTDDGSVKSVPNSVQEKVKVLKKLHVTTSLETDANKWKSAQNGSQENRV